MSVFTWPVERTKITASRFGLRTRSMRSISTFAPTRNVSLGFQFWACDLTYAPELGPSAWQDAEAYIARLDGDVNLIRIGDPLRCRPKLNRGPRTLSKWSDGTDFSDGTQWAEGVLPPTAQLAAAASRGADFIHIKGLPVSKANALAKGDLIELRPNGVPTDTGNLYMVVVGGGTDANGEIGVEIRPRLRQNFAVSDMVVLEQPMTVMRLSDPDQGAIERAANVGSFGFSAVEHLG